MSVRASCHSFFRSAMVHWKTNTLHQPWPCIWHKTRCALQAHIKLISLLKTICKTSSFTTTNTQRHASLLQTKHLLQSCLQVLCTTIKFALSHLLLRRLPQAWRALPTHLHLSSQFVIVCLSALSVTNSNGWDILIALHARKSFHNLHFVHQSSHTTDGLQLKNVWHTYNYVLSVNRSSQNLKKLLTSSIMHNEQRGSTQVSS